MTREQKHAMSLCAAYLGRMPRTERELRTYLERKGIAAEDAEFAVGEMLERGFLDDAALARSIAESAARTGKQGARAIEQKLMRRGIDRETVLEAAGTVAQADGENAVAAAKKLLPRYAKDEPPKARQKLIRALMSRGFGFEDALRAARAVLHGGDDEDFCE